VHQIVFNGPTSLPTPVNVGEVFSFSLLLSTFLIKEYAKRGRNIYMELQTLEYIMVETAITEEMVHHHKLVSEAPQLNKFDAK
jgi:hypothetical protein